MYHFRFHWYPHTDRVRLWKANRTKEPLSEEAAAENKSLGAINKSAKRVLTYFKETVVGYKALELLYWTSLSLPALVPLINKTYSSSLLNHKRRPEVKNSVEAFRMECLFKQRVDEWCFPIENTAKALQQLRRLIQTKKLKAHFPIEVRFAAQDDILLSPCYKRTSCYIGIITYLPYQQPQKDYQTLFQGFDAIALELGGRPHWAKQFSTAPHHFQTLYPHWHTFKRLRLEQDPHALFRNQFLSDLLLF